MAFPSFLLRCLLLPAILPVASIVAAEEAAVPAGPAKVFTRAKESLVWKPGKMGGGGFVTGIDINRSGSPMLVRTDVGGAYKWDDARKEWIQLVTTDRLPDGALGFFEYGGVSSIVSAPTDPNRLYMAFSGKLYFSEDQGGSWTMGAVTGRTGLAMDANARVGRLQGERLAVDPRNKDVVFFGSNEDGLWTSRDGGRSWTQVPKDQVPSGEAVPAKNKRAKPERPGIGQVHFDRSSSEINGRTSRLLATVWGAGLFESKDAGSTWTQVGKEKELALIESASIADDGTYFFAQREPANTAFLYRHGDLKQLSIPNKNRLAEAVIQPTDSNTLLHFGPGAMRRESNLRSTDGGLTWTGFAHTNLLAEDVPWLAKEAWFSNGAIVFDPIKPDRLWIAQGVGVWYSDDALTSKTITWHSRTAGIEELVVNEIVVPSPGQPLMANWDRPVIKVEDLNVYPKTWGPTEEFGSAWDLAVMASDPSFVVGIFQGQSNNAHAGAKMSGYSEDGGRTWTNFAFETFPFNVNDPSAWVYGNIAVSSKDRNNLVWFTVGNDGRFLYSHDRGANWKDAVFEDGVGGGTWNQAYFFYKQALVADPVEGDVFYAYNWKNKKIYCSEDGGMTFKVRGTVPSKNGDFHCKLRAVPGRAGHLFFIAGLNNNNFEADDMGPLLESRDGGATWTKVEPSLKIIDIAFGAPAPGSKIPTYYAHGQMLGADGPEWGVFRSLDEGATWEKISGIYPMGVSKHMSVLAADPGTYGRIYIGTGGIGFFHSELNSDTTTPRPGEGFKSH